MRGEGGPQILHHPAHDLQLAQLAVGLAAPVYTSHTACSSCFTQLHGVPVEGGVNVLTMLQQRGCRAAPQTGRCRLTVTVPVLISAAAAAEACTTTAAWKTGQVMGKVNP